MAFICLDERSVASSHIAFFVCVLGHIHFVFDVHTDFDSTQNLTKSSEPPLTLKIRLMGSGKLPYTLTNTNPHTRNPFSFCVSLFGWNSRARNFKCGWLCDFPTTADDGWCCFSEPALAAAAARNFPGEKLFLVATSARECRPVALCRGGTSGVLTMVVSFTQHNVLVRVCAKITENVCCGMYAFRSIR